MMEIAGVLGVKFETQSRNPEQKEGRVVEAPGPSIAELSRMVGSPRDIGGTLEASKKVINLVVSGSGR